MACVGGCEMKKRILVILLALMSLAVLPRGEAEEPFPGWSEVPLNENGFLDEGEFVKEDPEAGIWMYANSTLRICVTRTWETPEKIRKRDPNQEFNCFTAEIWCDTGKYELPMTLWADPTKPGNVNIRKTVAQIASEQGAVFAVSTDLFTARLTQKTAGVVIRNGEILYDRKTGYYPGKRPPFETLALYEDGHAESCHTAEKRGETYLEEGAVQVYTFGPVLVRDGEIPENIGKYEDRNLNPMHAFGVAEPGHYIDVLCEGRLKSVNGSTGVLTESLARIMKERRCSVAVCLDGGDSAVMTFMGKQLNRVAKIPSGRVTCEVLAFGRTKGKDAEKP